MLVLEKMMIDREDTWVINTKVIKKDPRYELSIEVNTIGAYLNLTEHLEGIAILFSRRNTKAGGVTDRARTTHTASKQGIVVSWNNQAYLNPCHPDRRPWFSVEPRAVRLSLETRAGEEGSKGTMVKMKGSECYVSYFFLKDALLPLPPP